MQVKLTPPTDMKSKSHVHDYLDRSRKQIRLFRLLPSASGQHVIHGSLEVFDLDRQCPPYQALSYQWGSVERFENIGINEGTLPIGQNLLSFLLHFRLGRLNQLNDQHRLKPSPKYIWIDQICIDQTSISERNHQVHFMSEIYSKAENVLAWTPESDASIARLENSIRAIKRSAPHQKVIPSDCFELFWAPYWRRVWIQQEILLARKVTVAAGHEHIGWHDMVQRLPTNPMAHPALLSLVQLRQDDTPIGNLSLLDALSSFSNCECSDPRDRVYGLQAIVNPRERINIDYSQDLKQVLVTAIKEIALRNLTAPIHPNNPYFAMRQVRETARRINPRRAWFDGESVELVNIVTEAYIDLVARSRISQEWGVPPKSRLRHSEDFVRTRMKTTFYRMNEGLVKGWRGRQGQLAQATWYVAKSKAIQRRILRNGVAGVAIVFIGLRTTYSWSRSKTAVDT